MGAPQADPPPKRRGSEDPDGENPITTKNRFDILTDEGEDDRRDNTSQHSPEQQQEVEAVPVKWGDRAPDEENEWTAVESTKKKKMERFTKKPKMAQKEQGDKNEGKAKIPKKTYVAPSYMDKLTNKLAKAAVQPTIRKDIPVELKRFHQYAIKQFQILPKLRKMVDIEREILILMREGTLSFEVMPSFLIQILSSRAIARLQTFLTKKHQAELYAQLSPGHRLSKNLPDYAIMRNVCTTGNTPQEVLDSINDFKMDATDVYFIAERRILVFRFANKDKADFWQGKELPYQNKPITLRYYFNNEAHQTIPPTLVDSAVITSQQSATEQLAIIERCKTRICYQFSIVNASPLLQHAHLEVLLQEVLHLEIASLTKSINKLTGQRRTSTWDVILQTEGLPQILNGITTIQWAEHSLMIFHHTIHTSLPCSKCFSHSHVFSRCSMKNATNHIKKNILLLHKDTDFQPESIDYKLEMNEEEIWQEITKDEVDIAFTKRIKQECSLDQFALEKDLQILYNKRKNAQKKEKKQQSKRRKNNKANVTIGPITEKEATVQTQLDQAFDTVYIKLEEMLGNTTDPFGIRQNS